MSHAQHFAADAGELTRSISIDAVLARRDATLERLEQAHALLKEAMVVGACFGDIEDTINDRSRYRPQILDKDAVDKARKVLDAMAWDLLMRESGLMTFMDSAARSAWRNKIAERATPAFQRDAIEATFAELYAARGQMFERGVINCFRNLSWHYKTNSPCRFGKRIIVEGLCRDFMWGYMCSRRCEALDDLVRVFCLLDGKPEPDHREAIFYWLCQLTNQRPRLQEAEHTYFKLRWYMNGNAHLTFTRPDLVDQLNAILARHYPDALPPRR